MNGSPGTLTELFAASVDRHGDRRAVADDAVALTYGELDDASDHLAGVLRARGVAPGDNVAVCLERGAAVVVAMLGVVKAGAAYVAIDAGYPRERRDAMVASSGATVLVTHEGWSSRFETVVDDVVVDVHAAASDPAPDDAAPVTPSSAACVLFTSGSTGEPKGIVLEHRSLVTLATNRSLPRLATDDKFGQISSVSFDGITLEVWAALAAGAEVVVLPDLASLLLSDIRRELKKRRITAMLVPASVLNEVCRVDRDAFSPLRWLFSGGDVILPATCRAILGGAFDGTLYNLYGPTEVTTAATAHRVDRVGDDDEAIPIGIALDRYETYVLDESMQPARRGDVGELYVGGDGVARGYLGRPAMTAERFVPNPFGAPGSRLYATGDRVREDADGRLEFLGRFDEQVKIRGHRIVPAEIERAMSRHRSVRQAAVVVDEVDGDRRLAGFVVPASESFSVKELRELLERSLPAAMVPSSISVIPEMPLTSNGKRDRKALLALRAREAERWTRWKPPATPTEEWVAALWERLLNVERVGATDDFFSIGGHSLLAFRARTAIARELDVMLDPHVVFEHSTVHDLAAIIDGASTRRRSSAS